jgi:hypothetical protein
LFADPEGGVGRMKAESDADCSFWLAWKDENGQWEEYIFLP